MQLYRIHLNPRNREVRRDLADPYQMHASLCRAFCSPERKCAPGAILWRLEPESDPEGRPRVLIQTRLEPNWSPMQEAGWLWHADKGIDLVEKLALDRIQAGRHFRFRLRANPCKTVQGKRQGLLNRDAQMEWLQRKGQRHGFVLVEPNSVDYFDFLSQPYGYAYSNCRITQEQMLRGRQHSGNVIHIYAVLFEGLLSVTDPILFRQALEQGIGHGKMMGLGLLSVVPVRG
ncbi:MAG: type I-E CRISPR-associated protein Cas6/Cse3/CasE [Halothiobacillaceae bacterium]